MSIFRYINNSDTARGSVLAWAHKDFPVRQAALERYVNNGLSLLIDGVYQPNYISYITDIAGAPTDIARVVLDNAGVPTGLMDSTYDPIAGGGGPASPDLTVGNASGMTHFGGNFRVNTSSGKYVLEELNFGVWKPVQLTTLEGTKLATSVETGVGSFHLGSVHSLSSGGQDMSVTNHVSGIAWSPVWQGMSADGNTLYPPSIRVPGAKVTIEPNGALLPASTPINYEVTFTVATNRLFIDLTVMPTETSTTGGWWVCEYTAGSVEIARIALPNWTAGTELKMAFGEVSSLPHCAPLSLRAGDTITTYIVRKDTGAKMLCRQGATTAAPWRRLSIRSFTDAEIVTAQGIQPPAGLELTGYPDGANYIIGQGITVNSAGVKYDFPDKVLTSWALPAASIPLATGINLGNTKGFVPAVATNLVVGTTPLVSLIAKDLVYCNGSVTASGSSKVLDVPKLEVITGGLALATPTGVYDTLDLSALRFLGTGLSINGPLNVIPTLPLVTTPYSVTTSVAWTGLSATLPSTKYTSISMGGPNCTTLSLPNCTTLTPNGLNTTGSTSLTTVSAPLLTTSGAINLTAPALTSLAMPSFTTAAGTFIITSAALTSVNLPVLATTASTFNITGGLIASILFPSLTTASLGFTINATTLTDLSVPVLTSSGSISITSSAIPTVNLPVLASTSGLSILGGGAITSFSAPALTTITGASTIQAAALSSLSLPQLNNTTGLFSLSAASLTSLSLPLLATAPGGISIAANTLPAISLPELTGTTAQLSTQCSAMTSFSAPKVTSVGQLGFTGSSTLTVSMPALTTITSGCTFAQPMGAFNLPALLTSTAWSFTTSVGAVTAPLLTTSTALSVTGSGNVASFNFPALTTLTNGLSIGSGVTIGPMTFGALPSITNFNIPTGTTVGNTLFSAVTAMSGAITIAGTIGTLSFPLLTSITGAFTVSGTAGAFSFPELLTISGGIGWSGSTSAITFPKLTTIVGATSIIAGGSLSFPALTSAGTIATNIAFTMPLLQTATSFNIGGSVITSLNFPNLTSLSGGIINNAPPLTNFTSISLPALTGAVGALLIGNSQTLPLLTTYDIGNPTSLTGSPVSLSFVAQTLTSFVIPASVKSIAGTVAFISTSMTSASLDNMLIKLASLDGTNGTTAWSNKTFSSTTTNKVTAASAAARTTLLGRGNTLSLG